MIYLDDALKDVDEIIDWYEQQSTGLGADFTTQLKATARIISTHGNSFAPLDKGFRRLRMTRFPYHVYFYISNEIAEIHAVIHAHRDPAYWRTRLNP